MEEHFKINEKTVEIGKRFGRLLVISKSELIVYRRKTGKKAKNQYWLCECDCGTVKDIFESSLRNKKTRSCGCFKIERNLNKAFPNDESAKHKLYCFYRFGAKKRNYEFLLTKEEFVNLIEQNCHYCNEIPLQKMKPSRSDNRHYFYNGIDRVDNTKGYTIENSVPCCGSCNIAKRSLTKPQFITLITKIYNNLVGSQCQ
jgi:hypothetical protein